jgi:hypothetical protein
MKYAVAMTGEDSGRLSVYGDKDEDRLSVEAEALTGGWSASFPLYRHEAQELIEALTEEFDL